MSKVIRDKDEIRNIFELACAKRAMLIFVTPYLRFESHFVYLSGSEVHVRVSRGKGDAIYFLRGEDLKLRFPFRYSFLEAPAKIIGFGAYEGTRTLMVELPKELCENDDRKAFRVERVGNIIATVSTPKNEIISASLLDISARGAKLSSKAGQMNKALKAGDRISLTIPIPNIVTINTGAIIRHMDASAFGIEYAPGLIASTLDPLSSWIFKKREEEKGRLALRDQSDNGETGPDMQKMLGKSEESRVLIVTSDDEIEGTLRKLLSGELLFLHSEPSVAAMKIALAKMPHLVILHLPANNMEKRRLMKSLAAMVPSSVPILLLGTDIDSGALYELSKEWKAASSIAWAKDRGILVQRLIVGMIRKHFGLGESPMVSMEVKG